MIIQLRGTSGSGKSTVVREVMKHYGPATRVKVAGRKQPLGYLLPHPHAKTKGASARSLFVVGHYETACGGCDTLPSYDRSIEVVRHAHAAGHDVLFEGLLISGEVQRCAQLHEDGLPLRVMALDTPVDVCVDSINTRRRSKNPDKDDVNPANTLAKFKTVQGAMRKLAERGVPTEWTTRQAAAIAILTYFDLDDLR